MGIDIDSPQYDPVYVAAWAAIGVYAFGLIAFNAVLLFLARKAILSNKPTPLSKAIRFLYKECACLRAAARRERSWRACNPDIFCPFCACHQTRRGPSGGS